MWSVHCIPYHKRYLNGQHNKMVVVPVVVVVIVVVSSSSSNMNRMSAHITGLQVDLWRLTHDLMCFDVFF
jgi:hypothetical protein